MNGASTPAPGRPGKLRTVQAMRAIAVLLVVWVHISSPYGFEHRYVVGSRLTRWMAVPTLIGVDLFFVISGVVIVAISWPSLGAADAWRGFAYRRITRIYPLYLIITALVLVVFLIRPNLVNSHDVHRPEILPSLLILPQPGDPLLAVGWTLVYELYFYAIFAIAMRFTRRRLPWILGGWASVTVLLHVLFWPSANPYLNVASNLVNLEFVLGAAVGLLVVHGRLGRPVPLLAGSLLSLGAVLTYLVASGRTAFPSQWFQVGVIGGLLAVGVYALVGLELQRRIRPPRLLERLGDGSYSIYLWHVPMLAVIGLGMERLHPRATVPHALALLAAFTISVAAAQWLYVLLERPLLRLLHTRRFRAPAAERPWKPAAEADIKALAHDAVV